MKNLIFYLTILLVILCSCKKSELVSFTENQPENVQALKEFPKKYQGTYYNIDEKTEITISKYFIFTTTMSEDTINIKDLDKNEIIKNDSLFKIKSKEKYRIKKINDSLITNYVFSDTIFKIGKTAVLKKFKGYLFLNKQTENSEFWNVEKLQLSKGVVKLSNIETLTELELLKNITEKKSDTTKPFNVKPTKRQFREFINSNGFSNGKIYLKK